MKKTNLPLRIGLIVVITILGLYKVFMPPVTGASARLPRKQDFTPSGIKRNLRENIRLGLDLKGGSHRVMRVKTEEYLKRLTEDNAVAAQNAAKDKGFTVTEAHAESGNGNYRVLMTIADASKAKDVRDAVQAKVDVSDNAGWSFSQSGASLIWSLNG